MMLQGVEGVTVWSWRLAGTNYGLGTLFLLTDFCRTLLWLV